MKQIYQNVYSFNKTHAQIIEYGIGIGNLNKQ